MRMGKVILAKAHFWNRVHFECGLKKKEEDVEDRGWEKGGREQIFDAHKHFLSVAMQSMRVGISMYVWEASSIIELH